MCTLYNIKIIVYDYNALNKCMQTTPTSKQWACTSGKEDKNTIATRRAQD